MREKLTWRRWLPWVILGAAVPAVTIVGGWVFDGKPYAFISLAITALCVAALMISFEQRRQAVPKLVIIVVMTALCVVGRLLFSAIPSFKPVTALVVVAALYFGGEAGCMIGVLTALISNLYFGQGPWTPFQMLAWGLMGLLAGVLAKPLKEHRWLLLLYGAVAGVLYSMVLDIWTVLFIDGYFNLPRFGAAMVTSASITVTYAVSNVVFLATLGPPLGRIFRRIQQKYGL